MTHGLVVRLRPTGRGAWGPIGRPQSGRLDLPQRFRLRRGDCRDGAPGRVRRVAGFDRARGEPAVSFSSCFPFLDEIGFVVPPRTIWPPQSPSLMGARVRWKSARFVPLTMVQSLVAGVRPDENAWSMDGPSECLVPAGRLGPFRTAVRFSAAVDR